jgi:hypothetical protein
MRQGLQSLLIKNRLVEIFVEEEEENPSEDMGYLAAQKPDGLSRVGPENKRLGQIIPTTTFSGIPPSPQ